MTAISYTNPIMSLVDGLIKGLGIGGVIMGIVAAIGFFLVVIGVIVYMILAVADVVEAAKEKASDIAADGIRAARERREE